MKIFVINMEKDVARKEYIKKIFDRQKIEEYEFVTAVNGKELSENEKNALFDTKEFVKLNAKIPNDSQIGCCLSHQLCYKKLLESKDEWCLILEDDILLPENFKFELNAIEDKLNSSEKPIILLLSGWFWYFNQNFLQNLNFKKVYSGFLAHSYLINRAAAQKLAEIKPFYTSDDWYNIRKKIGIDIYGRIPHLVNQNWNNNFESSTKSLTIKYEKGCIKAKLSILVKVIVQRIVKKFGNFEEAL